MYIKFAFKNLKNMILKQPLSFVVIILTQIFAAVSIFLSYGLIQNTNAIQGEVSEINRRFEIQLFKVDESTISYDKYGNIEAESIQMSYYEFTEKFNKLLEFINEEKDCHYVKGDLELGNEQYTMQGGYFYSRQKYDEMVEFSRKYSVPEVFTYENYINGDNVVEVSYDNYSCEENQIIDINGEKYTVIQSYKRKNIYDIGLSSTFNFTYKSMPKTATFRWAYVVLDDIPTQQRIEEINNKIQEIFGSDTPVTLPAVPDLLTVQFNRISYSISFAVILIIVLNVSFVYMYVLEKRKNWLYVMKFCGCKQKQCIMIFMLEILLIVAACLLAGTLIFKYGMFPYFAKMYPAFSLIFNTKAYLFICLSYMLLSIFIIFSVVQPFVKQTIISIKSRR